MGLFDSLIGAFSGGEEDPVSGIGPVADGSIYGSEITPSSLGSIVPSSSSTWSSGNFLGPLITAGAGLAGQYYTTQNANSQAAQSFQNQQALIADQDKQAEMNRESQQAVAGIEARAQEASAAMAATSAKRNTLANLYNNWADIAEKGGEAKLQGALGTGKAVSDAINVRSAALR